MRSDAGPRHVFLVLGSCMLMFSPAIIFFFPTMVPMTFFFEKYTWFYYTPLESFVTFGIGLGILIICCLILFFGRLQKKSIIISSVLALIASVFFYGSAMGYITMSEKGFTYREVFHNKKTYFQWEDVAHAEIEAPAQGTNDNTTFTFTFKDGEVITFKETKQIRNTRGKMRAMFTIHTIPVDYTEAELEE